MLSVKIERNPNGKLVRQIKNPISGAAMNKYSVLGIRDSSKKRNAYILRNNPHYEIYNVLLLKDGLPIADTLGSYKYDIPQEFLEQFARSRAKIVTVNHKIVGKSLKLFHGKTKLSIDEIEQLLLEYRDAITSYISGKSNTKPDVREFLKNKFPNYEP